MTASRWTTATRRKWDEDEETENDDDDDGEEEDGGEADDAINAAWRVWRATKPLYQPDVPRFFPPPPPPTVVSLRGRTVQVIVKLASIVLTPSQPRYAGGAWHVEGMRNECIVASGIAYYSQDNVGDSMLAFRQAVAEPEYEQGDHRGVREVWGLENERSLVQSMGAVVTCDGRCLAFPNVVQHRVSPFSLLDGGREGHRSILVFFLVDPTQRVLSTARVPPQQAHWQQREWAEALSGAVEVRELQGLTLSYVGWPMGDEEARQHREALMRERKFFVHSNTDSVFERAFSLCEH